MSWLTRLVGDEAAPMPPKPAGVGIDVGCGGKKHPGTVGLDIVDAPGVDHVLDFTRERLPFDDDSVSFVFSSHCVEHIADPLPLFRELTRVAAHGARLEIWTPYAFHEHAFLPGHVSYWTEVFYRHVSHEHTAVWDADLGGGWRIDEVVLVVERSVAKAMREQGVDLDFAVRHLHNVVFEMGVLGYVDKRGGPPRAPRVVIAHGRQGKRRPLGLKGLGAAAHRVRGALG